jgi:formate hydrogenlyase subunit 4
VFRLSGGVGLLLFVPTIYGSTMFSNLSFAGDLILALYFIFFGTLGMALGAGESGHPHAAIGMRIIDIASGAVCRKSLPPNCRFRSRCFR